MLNFAVMFLSLIGGVLLQKHSHSLLRRINQFILLAPLPATILLNIPKIQWSLDLVPVMMTAWVIFAGAAAFFYLAGRIHAWDSKLIVCLILTAGHGNTSFVGFPILRALLGEDSLKYGVLVDQPGTFLICSTFGVFLATKFSASVSVLKVLRKVLVFPPFAAFMLALAIGLSGVEFHPTLENLLKVFAWLLAPLAFVSVGLQLRWRAILEERVGLAWGLGYKLFLAPILILGLLQFFSVPPQAARVMLLEAAMAPMITSSILAASHGLHPRLAGVMVGVGVPLSFITLTVWSFMFHLMGWL